MATDKPKNRQSVSLRIPYHLAKEVEEYAEECGVRKTDAYVHLLNLGLKKYKRPGAKLNGYGTPACDFDDFSEEDDDSQILSQILERIESLENRLDELGEP